jgi:hypothetical protein
VIAGIGHRHARLYVRPTNSLLELLLIRPVACGRTRGAAIPAVTPCSLAGKPSLTFVGEHCRNIPAAGARPAPSRPAAPTSLRASVAGHFSSRQSLHGATASTIDTGGPASFHEQVAHIECADMLPGSPRRSTPRPSVSPSALGVYSRRTQTSLAPLAAHGRPLHLTAYDRLYSGSPANTPTVAPTIDADLWESSGLIFVSAMRTGVRTECGAPLGASWVL